MIIILYIFIGIFIGTISGIVGIGGGTVLVPILIYFFKMTQHMAQGTTLAMMVPPIGFLAAYTYYQKGFVDLKIAGFTCLGFFFGGLIGAKLAVNLPALILKRIFGIYLIIIGIRMLQGC